MKLTNEEIEAIYCCISFSQDLRNELGWTNEQDYWAKWDLMSKSIDTALIAANKLAGYDTGV